MPAATPSGTPTSTAMATDTIINASVSIVGCHNPNIPGRVMATAAVTAVSQCPVRPISARTINGRANHGSRWSCSARVSSDHSTASLKG